MSNMEGGRGMFVVFVCAPLGILVGLVIGIISSILVRREGLAGFLAAQSWSLLIVCGVAGVLAGVPYLLSDKPPRIDGKRLELQFITQYFLDNETDASQADFLARAQLYRGDYRYADAFVADLKSVTPEQALS